MPSLAGGGAERIMLTLAAEFAARGYAVDVVLASAEGEYLDSVPTAVHLVDLRATRPLTAIPGLVRYLRAHRPWAVMTTILSANLAALCTLRLSGVRTRLVVREASTLSADVMQMSPLNRLLTPWLIGRNFALAHAFVAPSKGAADDLAKTAGIPRDSIQVIYNPVISASLIEKARRNGDHPWLNDEGPPVIIGMGRLTKQKDFATLIQAFARLQLSLPSRLIILGEGEDRNALETLQRNLGVDAMVDMPGFVSNPYAFLSRSSLFVLSSRWEGLPGALIEALACGTKVVSTDCPSGPREILCDGAYGQLVPIEDDVAMASAMHRALTGSFVAEKNSDWLRQFEFENNIDRYLDLLVG